MQNSVLAKIIDFIFGRKYYATIMNTRGTDRCDINSKIFLTKQAAEAHRHTLDSTASYMWIETISFRSHKDYAPNTLTDKTM
jgi:hypothetical protein